LEWIEPTYFGGANSVYYELYNEKPDGEFELIGSDIGPTSYTVSGLVVGQTYKFYLVT
jgi:hypothetical protein